MLNSNNKYLIITKTKKILSVIFVISNSLFFSILNNILISILSNFLNKNNNKFNIKLNDIFNKESITIFKNYFIISNIFGGFYLNKIESFKIHFFLIIFIPILLIINNKFDLKYFEIIIFFYIFFTRFLCYIPFINLNKFFPQKILMTFIFITIGNFILNLIEIIYLNINIKFKKTFFLITIFFPFLLEIIFIFFFEFKSYKNDSNLIYVYNENLDLNNEIINDSFSEKSEILIKSLNNKFNEEKNLKFKEYKKNFYELFKNKKILIMNLIFFLSLFTFINIDSYFSFFINYNYPLNKVKRNLNLILLNLIKLIFPFLICLIFENIFFNVGIRIIIGINLIFNIILFLIIINFENNNFKIIIIHIIQYFKFILLNSLYTFFFIKLIKIFENKFIIEISGILSISKFLFNLIVIIFENNFDPSKIFNFNEKEIKIFNEICDNNKKCKFIIWIYNCLNKYNYYYIFISIFSIFFNIIILVISQHFSF